MSASTVDEVILVELLVDGDGHLRDLALAPERRLRSRFEITPEGVPVLRSVL